MIERFDDRSLKMRNNLDRSYGRGRRDLNSLLIVIECLGEVEGEAEGRVEKTAVKVT